MHGVSINEGNYSYYLEKKKARDAVMQAAKPKPAKKKRGRGDREADKPRKLKWKEERELESMEETILQAEEEVAGIETKLNDPAFYIENSEKAVDMAKDLEGKKVRIQTLYTRWEELEAIRVAWEAG